MKTCYQAIDTGCPIDISMPKGGFSWESDAPKRLLDSSLSKDASKPYNEFFPVAGHKSVNTLGKNYQDVEGAMVNMGF